jgi:hypothetical protein
VTALLELLFLARPMYPFWFLGELANLTTNIITLHWISVFIQFFCEFVVIILTAHARSSINLYTQGSYSSIIVSAQVGLARGEVSRNKRK